MNRNTRKKTFFRLLLPVLLLALLAVAAAAAGADDFYAALEQNLRQQNTRFTIPFEGDVKDLEIAGGTSLGAVQRTTSARSPDGPDNADYPALNINEGALSWNPGSVTFSIEYLATPEEIAEVDRRASEIVSSFQMQEESDEARIKLLYEYICTHYTYDKTLTKFSAYDGLTTGSMVCQGYALLTYKVMWKTEIPCRIVTGISRNETHAWNIVELDGVWYNLDTTWDAADEPGGAMTWDFFPKSEDDFPEHRRFGAYLTDEYQAAHPMAETSREIRRFKICSGTDKVSNLICRVGVPVQLGVELPDGVQSGIHWASGNPSAISISETGVLEASSLGEAVITAQTVDRREFISAQIHVQSVDLRQTSPWAFDAVTKVYLGQLLPFSLCGNFRAGLTRGELARFCYQYILNQVGWEAMVLERSFSDILESADAIRILRCSHIGLMKGTGDGKFSPDAPVSRQQAAVVTVRLIEHLTGSAPAGGSLEGYSDAASIADWASDSVAAATRLGIFRGSNGCFRPAEPVSREEMAVILSRVYELFPVSSKEDAA